MDRRDNDMSINSFEEYPWLILVGLGVWIVAVCMWAWIDARDCRRDEERRRQHRALSRRPHRGGLR